LKVFTLWKVASFAEKFGLYTGQPLHRKTRCGFIPKRIVEVLRTGVQWRILVWRVQRILKRVKADPNKKNYTDLALTPVLEQE